MIAKFNIIKKIHNLRQTKLLMEKYRNITEGDLLTVGEKEYDILNYVSLGLILNKITGFGTDSCTLCRITNGNYLCGSCIYLLSEYSNIEEVKDIYENAVYCADQPTYKAIGEFRHVDIYTVADAIKVICDRADYIEQLINIAVKNGAKKSDFE